jgi:hypothetical protein
LEALTMSAAPLPQLLQSPVYSRTMKPVRLTGKTSFKKNKNDKYYRFLKRQLKDVETSHKLGNFLTLKGGAPSWI